jgi:ABC-type branched-subunit amino acid transport system permease subunit
VIGASIFTLLPNVLQAFEDYSIVIYGAILLFILMFMPQGLAGLTAVAAEKSKKFFGGR